MATKLLQFEGTWEEIAAKLPDFNGHRLRITVEETETSASEPGTPEIRPSSTGMTIEERIIARFANTPPEERAKLPADLTDNLDHYIYGWPKK